jgi:hypothetical protein
MNAKTNNGKPEIVDANMLQAVSIAEKIAPYIHARLSAVKLAGDPNDPIRRMASMSADQLKAEIMASLEMLGPVLDLPAAYGGLADRLPAKAMNASGEAKSAPADRSR